jgi:hypothetical protein
MALIFCPECGNKVSEFASICLSCSYPISNLRNGNFSEAKKKVKVENTIVWILAFAPLIGELLQCFIAGLLYGDIWERYYEEFWIVTIILNILLCHIDENKLKNQGIDTEEFGSTWLVPVYLYRRAKHLGHDQAYFWVWIVLFTLDFFSFL